MKPIYHICPRDEWRRAREAGEYRGDTLANEGFIHCSTAPQVLTVADRLFKGRKDLCLLLIDELLVDREVRYENLEGGQALFPHIYGPLVTKAVLGVAELVPDAQGRFTFPTGPKAFTL